MKTKVKEDYLDSKQQPGIKYQQLNAMSAPTIILKAKLSARKNLRISQ